MSTYGDNMVMRNRRSIRLPGFDYSQAGAYFVTIRIQDGARLFGEVEAGSMVMSDAGKMVNAVWHELSMYYPGVTIDAFQIMPNHIHGIIVLHDAVGATPRGCPDRMEAPRGCPDHDAVGATPRGCPDRIATPRGCPDRMEAPRGCHTVGLLSLPDVVHRFKTMTTKRYTDGVKQQGWPRFAGRLWQRNYYEHIIRDEDDLNRIRRYIEENPAKWESDRYNR
jgi:REP element-mobilizing transposase RayT